MDISDEVSNLIEKIRNNKTDGASELARQAVTVLQLAAERSQTLNAEEFSREQEEIGQRLISSHPAMAPIFNIVSRILKVITGMSRRKDLDAIRKLVISRADELVANSLKAIAQITRYSSKLIADGDTIMTHSYSSTVTAALKEAFIQHRDIEVIATRSGAGRTGERIARELGDHGIPIIFIDDTAAGLYIPMVNKVMVGADRICADGAVVNGIGTYQLALVSDRAKIPFYVLCETLKFDSRLKSDEIDLEEKEPSEVVEPEKLPPSVMIKNPYFDITPIELITAVVTENGLLTAKKLSKVWKETVYKNT